MQNSSLPNPNGSQSWRDWANSLTAYLARNVGRLEATPVKLEHKNSASRASAADAGVLMYDTEANAVAYSDGQKWNVISAGGSGGSSGDGGSGPSGPVSWTDVINKPATYPPAPHSHSYSELSGSLPFHRHAYNDLTGSLPSHRHAYSDMDGNLPYHRHDASDIDNLPTSGGGGGSSNSPVTTFQARAAAQAADISSAIQHITVTGLQYQSDPYGTALETANGRKWSPRGVVSPLHWGAVGDGIADDRAAVQASVNFFVKSVDSKPDAHNNSPLGVWDGLGKQYAISGPIFVGNVGAGAGMIYHTTFKNMKLVALPGDWSGEVIAGVPKQMLVVAWRQNQNYSDLGAGLFNNVFDRVTLDCRYLTGGIYLENTNSNALVNSRIARVGKNRCGYDTAQFRTNGANHPTGFIIGNGALLVENLIIGALEEEADPEYPPGETKDTMNTIGMRHRTNDARLNNIIINGSTVAAEFNDCGAVQVHNFHPWSKKVILGPNVQNFMFSNCYFDFTWFQIIGNFNHYFNGCHWILGNGASPANNGLELVADTPNATAEGLILNGCRFRNDIGITFSTVAGGSWVEDAQRKYEMVGCVFDTNVPPYVERLSNNLLIRADGVVEVVADNSAVGRAVITGDTMALGAGRTSNGYAAVTLYGKASPDPTFRLEQLASGTVGLMNTNSAGHITLGNEGTGKSTALSVRANGGIRMSNIPTYSGNSAAVISGNLTTGDLYKTSAGALMIVY